MREQQVISNSNTMRYNIMLTPKLKRQFDDWLSEPYNSNCTHKDFIFEEVKNYNESYSKYMITNFLEMAFMRGYECSEKRHLHGLEVN